MAGRTAGFSIEGQPHADPGQMPFVDYRTIIPGYFQTMRIPVLSGRDVSWTDGPDERPVVVVSETLARSFWPHADPVGKRLKLGKVGDGEPWLTVVGVVGNARQLDLQSTPRPAVYLAASQDTQTGDIIRDWVLRIDGDPESPAPAIRAAVWRVDPTLPVSRMQTMDGVHAAYLGPQQFSLTLVGLFAALALVLAAVGLYGVTAYSVAQRTRELGIRMALGARPGDLLRMVIGEGARLAAAGLIIGCAVAFVVTHTMQTLLFGIGARDPLTFAGAAALLFVIALLACYLPARRAARLHPTMALRTD
jgi:predicted permease